MQLILESIKYNSADFSVTKLVVIIPVIFVLNVSLSMNDVFDIAACSFVLIYNLHDFWKKF